MDHDDEALCLFVILSCGLVLVMPSVVQPLFAVFVGALVIAAVGSRDTTGRCGQSGARRSDRHHISDG
jgi:hypothetical protein